VGMEGVSEGVSEWTVGSANVVVGMASSAGWEAVRVWRM
jgi:hypothetical protein